MSFNFNNRISSGKFVLNGNMCTVKGKTYKLPRYRSMTVNNNEIYLDGKKWSPVENGPKVEIERKEFNVYFGEEGVMSGRNTLK